MRSGLWGIVLFGDDQVRSLDLGSCSPQAMNTAATTAFKSMVHCGNERMSHVALSAHHHNFQR